MKVRGTSQSLKEVNDNMSPKQRVYRRGNRIHFRAVRGKNTRIAVSRERLVQAGVSALTQVHKDFQNKEGSVAEWVAFIISQGT